MILIRLKKNCGGLISQRRWGRDVEVLEVGGTIRRTRRESNVMPLKGNQWQRW